MISNSHQRFNVSISKAVFASFGFEMGFSLLLILLESANNFSNVLTIITGSSDDSHHGLASPVTCNRSILS